MARFLAFVLFAAAGVFIAADIMHFANHGAWSLYSFGNLLTELNIAVDSTTAPLTHEFLAWMRPAPLGITAACTAVVCWMLQPRYFPKAIADFA